MEKKNKHELGLIGPSITVPISEASQQNPENCLKTVPTIRFAVIVIYGVCLKWKTKDINEQWIDILKNKILTHNV